jgi:hypothetical protein
LAAADINVCHPLWLNRQISPINPTNGTPVRCYGNFDAAAAANEVILGLMVMLYSGMQAVCANRESCADIMRTTMAMMSDSQHSAWSV